MPPRSTPSRSPAGCAREGARPAVLRLHELGALALAGGSTERLSLLGQLRMVSAAGAEEVYGYERWEGLRLRAGSAALALRMADELGARLRLGARVTALDVAPGACRVTLAGGEELRAEAVVCALPVGPLRDVAISGVSDARLASLHRQRQALAAKLVAAYPEPVWRAAGASGLCDGEGLVSSTWPQGPDALSMLVAPERLAHFLAAPPERRRAEVLDTLARLYGEPARAPDALLERAWGVDPLTQGYVAQWAPGRPHGGRPAARHARAAVLRLRLRPLGRGLHGGSGPHRPRRGRGRARDPGGGLAGRFDDGVDRQRATRARHRDPVMAVAHGVAVAHRDDRDRRQRRRPGERRATGAASAHAPPRRDGSSRRTARPARARAWRGCPRAGSRGSPARRPPGGRREPRSSYTARRRHTGGSRRSTEATRGEPARAGRTRERALRIDPA